MNEKAEELFQSGKAALESGNYEEALKQLSKSLSWQSRPEAYLLKAKAELKRRDKKKAKDECDNGLRAFAREGDSSSTAYLECVAMKDDLTEKIAEEKQKAKEKQEAVRQHKASALQGSSAKALAKKFEKPSLRLTLTVSAKVKDLSSRIGGIPSVPAGFKWPESKGRKLDFLCQVNLADLKKFKSISSSLPASGMLSFFYDVEEQPWGTVGDAGNWQVFNFDSSQPLSPATVTSDNPVKAGAIKFKEEPSYPDPLSDELNDALSEEESEEYDEFCQSLNGESPCHRLLGHPSLIQCDLREGCESATTGLSIAPKSVEEQNALFDKSREWILLLQIDSSEEHNIVWGDSGILYFCIRESDLNRGDFSKVWVLLQCT